MICSLDVVPLPPLEPELPPLDLEPPPLDFFVELLVVALLLLVLAWEVGVVPLLVLLGVLEDEVGAEAWLLDEGVVDVFETVPEEGVLACWLVFA